MIYETYNPENDTVFYICPDQESIDLGKACGYTGVFSIGTEADANVILASNQALWLEHNQSLFSVNKDTPVTEGIQWEPCDLANEQPNTDIVYNIFAVVDGVYHTVTGLSLALEKLQEVKQNFLVHSGLGSLISFEQWESPVVGTITGVQDF
jgi:hypothetical protein